MKSQSLIIRTIIDEAMANAPGMTMLMVALANHHGGGGLEWGAKANAQCRFEDGEVDSNAELLKKLSTPLRKIMKLMDADPARSNGAVVAFRTDAGIAINILIIRPGDIEKGQFASFEAFTEAEYFAIANGPQPERYPYNKMAQPVGMVMQIDPSGVLSDPVETIPPALEWFYCPIDWQAVAGLPAFMAIPDPVPPQDAPPTVAEGHALERSLAPFIQDVVVAIGMQPPGLRDIRRIGVSNGFRDKRGNVID